MFFSRLLAVLFVCTISTAQAQIYLNEGFQGGATRFLSLQDESIGFDVVPQAGSIILFQHDCHHEGSLLVHGRKYALRTDVMYSNKGVDVEYSKVPVVLARRQQHLEELDLT